MHVRCPHCRNPIELVDETPLTEISCPSCGSNFNLISDGTTASYREAGRMLGRFQLVQHVGVGHFGSVWKARDTELDRTVAVKIPRGETLDEKQRELFFREARAAAQLRHPHIVSVHEVGRDDSTIYIVSDYVDGATLKDWLAVRKPTPREAAELCITLAEALHHAHEAGIVHRDLKPANVMMDADGKPAIMDFGLAKRDAGEITVTIDGQILGTPAYMSPEQARGEGHAADRRADVYSLGVILFELLTGELPFRGEKRMLIVQILTDDPPWPRRLNSHVPRDLETICLKCLRKEPERRYGTALDLADDLRRFVEGKPITARPVSRLERGWRWCRRNPALAIVSGVALALLLTMAIGGPLVASRQAALRRDADQQRDRTISLATDLSMALSELEAANQQLSGLLFELGLSRSDQRQVDKAITAYRRAAAILERLRQDDPKSPAYQKALARTYNNLGNLKRAIGQPDEALAAYLKVLKIFDRLATENPDDTQLKSNLADIHLNIGVVYGDTGRPQEALAAYQRASKNLERLVEQNRPDPGFRSQLGRVLNNLGVLYRRMGRLPDALAAHQRAWGIRQRLVRDHRDVIRYRNVAVESQINIGNVYFDLGKLREALDEYHGALKALESLTREHPAEARYREQRATCYYNISNVYRQTKQRPLHSLEYLRKALQIREGLASEHPTQVAYQSAVARTHNAIGTWYRETRPSPETPQFQEALAAYQLAMAIRQRLVLKYPTATEHQSDLAESRFNIGGLLLQMGKPDAAVGHLDRAIPVYQQLRKRFPASSRLRSSLKSAYGIRANAFEVLGRHRDAALDWRNVVQLETGPTRFHYARFEANAFARGGLHAEATNVAGRLVPNSRNPGDTYYLATVYAISSGAANDDSKLSRAERRKLRDIYAGDALTLLKRGIADGLFQSDSDKKNLATDPDLDPLRNRDDFQQFCRKLGVHSYVVAPKPQRSGR